jgi:ABC-2 type transport system ATP-binding protein
MDRIKDMPQAAQMLPARPVTPNSNGAGEIVIEARGLSKRFNNGFAVQDVTLAVPRGTLFGFIGPSGCGKTTTVRLLTGAYAPTSGAARVLGQEPTAFAASARQRLGYLPQQFVLYPNLSVWENLNFAASLYGMGWRRGLRLNEMLDFVELSGDRGKLARDISGGMQRRLALAATLAHDPEVLFLDEPTAGVDPILRRKFWDYFKALRDAGHTLFITTQYVSEAAYCDKVGVMSQGRLLMAETPAGLYRRAYGGEIVHLLPARPLSPDRLAALAALPCVLTGAQPLGDGTLRLVVDDAGTAVPALLEWCRQCGIAVEHVERHVPPIDDVFVELHRKYATYD